MDGVPIQPFTVGVTVMSATWFVVPLFVAINPAMLPEPLPARPIVVLSFVHAKLLVPLSGLVNVSVVVVEPLHTDWFTVPDTVGVG